MSGEHQHNEYAPVVSLNALSDEVARLRVEYESHKHDGVFAELEHTHTESPPVIPPVTPPDNALNVPAGANWQWFIDHAEAPVFKFNHPYSGSIPAFTETKYIADYSWNIGQEYQTAEGVARSRTPDSGFTSLTNISDNPIFIKVGNGIHKDVLIEGFEVSESPAGGLQQASMVDFSGFVDSGVANCHIHHNGGNPVRVDGDRTFVIDSLLHDNKHLAIAGSGSKGVVVQGNEWHDNSTSHSRYSWEHGGLKLTVGDGLIANNLVYNESHGIWTDINAYHHIKGNYVHSCPLTGIFAGELTLPGKLIEVTGNYAIGNGATKLPGIWDASNANIKLATGDGILVSNNDIVQTNDQAYGLSLVQQSRLHHNQWYYVNNIDIIGNRFKRNGYDKYRIKFNDDTDHPSKIPLVEQGFIMEFLANWQNKAKVDTFTAARINQSTWESIASQNALA